MGQPIGTQALDESRVYKLTLGGAPLAPSLLGAFAGSETLTATLWPGGSYPVAATLTAAWATTDAYGVALTDNPASQASPVLDLTITPAMLVGLAPGTWWAKVVNGAGTLDERLYEGTIELTEAAGATAEPRTYCSWSDLRAECSWINQVEGLRDARAAQFLPERAQASRWAERQAHARWARDVREQGRRHGPVLAVDPIEISSGIDAGPTWGPSAIEDTTYRDSESAFAALVADPGLTVDAPGDFGTLARMTACYALGLILDDQVGERAEGTSYQMEARRYRKEALGLLQGIEFRVAVDGVGYYRLVP